MILDAHGAVRRSEEPDAAWEFRHGLRVAIEDVRNPHDFPELHDPDWHYADGVLAGIQSVATALRAMRKSE